MNIYGSARPLFTVKEFVEGQRNMFQEGMKKRKAMDEEVPESIKRMRELQEQREREAQNIKNDQVAKKIARGQYVTAAEQKRLYKDSPEKFQKAVLAAKMREAISKRLNNAKTKMEKTMILSEGKSLAVSLAGKGDQELGELYLEAINKAEKDDTAGKSTSSSNAIITDSTLLFVNQGPTIDVKG